MVQRALDCVSESTKLAMVQEMLEGIPETIGHRYACHVWQKLLEVRWKIEPPDFMSQVNNALRYHWHDVALGESGSLVVQNIFENCLEEQKVRSMGQILTSLARVYRRSSIKSGRNVSRPMG